MKALVLTCEHAQWGLPAGIDLGVSEEVLQSQASWDHGALDIARAIGRDHGVSVHEGKYSRLFVDLNRPFDHPDVVPVLCYGAEVPKNRGLSREAIEQRLAEQHAPHWQRVHADVAAHIAAGKQVIHLASHSFCTLLDPPGRQFDVGLLFDPSRELEVALVERLESALARHGLSHRRNKPYEGTGPGLPSASRAKFAPASYVAVTIETSHAVTMRPGGCAQVAHAFSEALADLKM